MLAATMAAKSAAYDSATCRSRNALATTLTDDNAMAAAPMVGDSDSPNGNKTERDGRALRRKVSELIEVLSRSDR